jgi:hypothetical protein
MFLVHLLVVCETTILYSQKCLPFLACIFSDQSLSYPLDIWFGEWLSSLLSTTLTHTTSSNIQLTSFHLPDIAIQERDDPRPLHPRYP